MDKKLRVRRNDEKIDFLLFYLFKSLFFWHLKYCQSDNHDQGAKTG